MPKIAIYKFLTFFIYSFDAINEPPHLHISTLKSSFKTSAKIWLNDIRFADVSYLNEKEQKLVIKLVTQNQAQLIKLFNDVSQHKKNKCIN